MQRLEKTPNLHRVVLHNGIASLAGVTAGNKSEDLAGQTRQILARIEELLRMVGSDRSKIISATIFLTDMSAKGQFNEVWSEWFAPEILPARAVVGVASLGDESTKIEIVCTAAV